MEIIQYDYTERGGGDEEWTKSLSCDKLCHSRFTQCSQTNNFCTLFLEYNPTNFADYPYKFTLKISNSQANNSPFGNSLFS